MNIKGHCRVELRDTKTGALEVCENHNMVTNALTEIYKQGGLTNPSLFNVGAMRTDALHNLLGGVLLLDTALEEDATLIRVPTGIGMTGNAVYGVLNSGAPTELGSYNEAESGWQQDGSLKYVFDWGTSGGNGTIASVCLSSFYGAYRGIGNKSGGYKTNESTMSGYNSIVTPASLPNGSTLGIYNNVRTVLTPNDAGYGAQYWDNRTTWTVNKYALPVTSVDLRDTINNRLIESKTVTLPSALQGLSGYEVGEVAGRQVGQYVYIMLCSAYTTGSYYTRHFRFNNDYPVLIARYNLANDTVELYKTLSPSTTGLSAFEVDAGVYPNACLNENYAIYSKYIFDLQNLADVTELTDIGEYGTSISTIDEFIAESNAVRVDMGEGTWLPVNPSSSGHYTTLLDSGLLCSEGSYIWRDPRYIATIYNLEAPVTKTADKTMKVTYVLRFS